MGTRLWRIGLRRPEANRAHLQRPLRAGDVGAVGAQSSSLGVCLTHDDVASRPFSGTGVLYPQRDVAGPVSEGDAVFVQRSIPAAELGVDSRGPDVGVGRRAVRSKEGDLQAL